MFRINMDITSKIFIIEISGSLSQKEINLYIKEFDEFSGKFRPKLYSMLISAQRLDPFPQENLLLFQQVIEIALNWANKIAVLNGNRTVTKIQLERIETEARKNTNSTTPIMRFQYMNEAMNFLMKE